MVLGSVSFNERKTNVNALNLLFIRDCRTFVKAYWKSNKHKDDRKRLEEIEKFIKSQYHIRKSIRDLLLEMTIYLKIYDNHVCVLDTGTIDGIPVDTLYKLITYGNLSVSGVSIFEHAFKYAILKKNWREMYGH